MSEPFAPLLQVLAETPTANAVANVSSVLGLLGTLFAIYKIATIRRGFQVLARLPELRTELWRHRSILNRYLSDYSEQAVLEELARCDATLTALKARTSGNAKTVVKSVQKAVRRFRRRATARSAQSARSVYYGLLELEVTLDNLQHDLHWR